MVKSVGVEGVSEKETPLNFVGFHDGGEQCVNRHRRPLMNDAAVGGRTTKPVGHGKNGTEVVYDPFSELQFSFQIERRKH